MYEVILNSMPINSPALHNATCLIHYWYTHTKAHTKHTHTKGSELFLRSSIFTRAATGPDGQVKFHLSAKPIYPAAFSIGQTRLIGAVAHEAIAIQVERFSLLQIRDGLQKRQKISLTIENRLVIVAAVDAVVNQAVGDRSQGAWHSGSLAEDHRFVKRNSSDPFFPRSPLASPESSMGHVLLSITWVVKGRWTKTPNLDAVTFSLPSQLMSR